MYQHKLTEDDRVERDLATMTDCLKRIATLIETTIVELLINKENAIKYRAIHGNIKLIRTILNTLDTFVQVKMNMYADDEAKAKEVAHKSKQ